MLITAAICTYNRAGLLAGAIESLCRQTLPAARYEILVVDNASTDQTAARVAALQGGHPEIALRYVYEPREGLGIARNRALGEARGAYLAYLDDDARAAPDWLEQACELIAASQDPACAGGPVYPFYTTAKPEWFLDRYETRSWGDDRRLLQPGESFSGSNMIWNRAVLNGLGGFDERIGMQGDRLSVGEETVAFQKLWRHSHAPVLIYSPVLNVYHWVPPYKLRVRYYLKRAFAIGQAQARLDSPSSGRASLRSILRSGGAALLLGIVAMLHRPRYPRWQNWAVEEAGPVLSKYGLFLASLGIRYPLRSN